MSSFAHNLSNEDFANRVLEFLYEDFEYRLLNIPVDLAKISNILRNKGYQFTNVELGVALNFLISKDKLKITHITFSTTAELAISDVVLSIRLKSFPYYPY